MRGDYFERMEEIGKVLADLPKLPEGHEEALEPAAAPKKWDEFFTQPENKKWLREFKSENVAANERRKLLIAQGKISGWDWQAICSDKEIGLLILHDAAREAAKKREDQQRGYLSTLLVPVGVDGLRLLSEKEIDYVIKDYVIKEEDPGFFGLRELEKKCEPVFALIQAAANTLARDKTTAELTAALPLVKAKLEQAADIFLKHLPDVDENLCCLFYLLAPVFIACKASEIVTIEKYGSELMTDYELKLDGGKGKVYRDNGRDNTDIFTKLSIIELQAAAEKLLQAVTAAKDDPGMPGSVTVDADCVQNFLSSLEKK